MVTVKHAVWTCLIYGILSHCGEIDGGRLCLNVAVTENMQPLDGSDDLKKLLKV